MPLSLSGSKFYRSVLLIFAPVFCPGPAEADDASAGITIDWSHTEMTSRSTPTLQVVVNPPLRRGSSIHDTAFAALHDLGASYVRFVPWLPYPRLAVAELEPPTREKTSWDLTQIDPMTVDFLQATQGYSTILNFSTIPAWMFKTPQPVTYPTDPDQVVWNYTQGTELRDASLKELADYYARLVSWYAKGGFTDELGKFHASGHHFILPYWEVFNEIEAEHQTTPQQYTQRYDAVVEAIHRVSPQTKFVGLALADAHHLDYFNYFLDPKNHRPGIPLDMISYHFYGSPADAIAAHWQFFAEADRFVQNVRQIEAIRQRLSPSTKSTIDEIGVILPNDNGPVDDTATRIPPIYWNAAGAMYAYLYLELSKLGIDVIGESQLVGCPTQFPSVSMIDWRNGKPNARFQVLKLLKENFGPGDKLVETRCGSPDIAVQGYQTSHGRALLLINKRNASIPVRLPPETVEARVDEINETTGDDPPESGMLSPTRLGLILAPFEVAVVRLHQ